MTDHGDVKYLIDEPKLNAQQVIWLALISEFNFEIKYINGKENNGVDALNGRLQLSHVVSVSSCEINMQEKI